MMGHCNIKKFNILGSRISQKCDCLCVFYFFIMVVGITLLTRICCNGSSPGENIFTVTVDCLTLGSTTTANLSNTQYHDHC